MVTLVVNVIQASTSTGDVVTSTHIGSVLRWTIEQEEQLKVYSRKRALAQIGSVPRWTIEQEDQLKVYVRNNKVVLM